MKELKDRLTNIYSHIEPREMDSFILSLSHKKSSIYDLSLQQLSYLRKRSIVLSLIFFILLITAFETAGSKLHIIWYTSSLMPFLSFMTISELLVSRGHNMSEIEMTTYYNVSHIALIRIALLGLINLLAIISFTLVIRLNTNLQGMQILMYILLPYILTCLISIFILNRFNLNNHGLICGVVAMTVSMFSLLSKRIIYVVLVPGESLYTGFLICVFLILMLLKELYCFTKGLEELQWS